MDSLPDEVIFMKILPNIIKWYPIIFHVSKRFNYLMGEALKFDHLKYNKRSNKQIKKRRNLTLSDLSKICIKYYPNNIIWQCNMGYIHDFPKYYKKCLNIGNFKLAMLFLDKINHVNGYLMDLTVRIGDRNLIHAAHKKYHNNSFHLCDLAAQYGKQDNMVKLIELGYNYDRDTGRTIIQNRHYDMLKWWIENNLPCYKRTHDTAKELLIIPTDTIWINPNKRRRKN